MRRRAAAALVVAVPLALASAWAGLRSPGTPGGEPVADPSSPCARESPPAPAEARPVRVRRVVDGDTFVAGDGTRVRLLGIDTPESADPRRPVERYGKEAAAFARGLLQGRTVLVRPGRNPRDPYGRTLAWVWLPDGRFVNAELVRLGFAQVYTFPDNPDHADLLLRCQREARDAGRGLWGR